MKISRRRSNCALDNPEPYLGRGIARAEQRRYRDALEDFDSCIARKPDHEVCCVERALAFTGISDFTHALADLYACAAT